MGSPHHDRLWSLKSYRRSASPCQNKANSDGGIGEESFDEAGPERVVFRNKDAVLDAVMVPVRHLRHDHIELLGYIGDTAYGPEAHKCPDRSARLDGGRSGGGGGSARNHGWKNSNCGHSVETEQSLVAARRNRGTELRVHSSDEGRRSWSPLTGLMRKMIHKVIRGMFNWALKGPVFCSVEGHYAICNETAMLVR